MYNIIYADNPWGYNDKKPRGGAEHHYRTMSLEDLKNLRVEGKSVEELSAADAVLFMWATWPLLPEALEVGSAWGFRYKTCAFNWVKTNKDGSPFMGLGHWTRGNSEPCLLFVRGRPKRISAGVRQVYIDEGLDEETVFAPRGRHSAKPQEIRDRIVKLMGDLPRIELFARERVPGWDAFGNEI